MLTVGLPLYRARAIVWLALESLCRQEGAGEWELLLCEESHGEAVGWDGVSPYVERLRAAGCVRVEFVPLVGGWIPLSLKWHLIGQVMSLHSAGLILQAADCYSHPRRLAVTRRALGGGATWVQQPRGLFYHAHTGEAALFDLDHPDGYSHPTALSMAICGAAAREIPVMAIRRGVDSALYRWCERREGFAVATVEEGWREGLDTHGQGRISTGRDGLMRERIAPFREPEGPQADDPLCYLPGDIAERLRAMRGEA